MFIPTTRKAWVVTQRGHPSQVLKLRDIPMPVLSPGDILVKVHAAALNPTCYKLIMTVPNFLIKRPHIAEMDLCGTVVDQIGTDFKNGDEVFGTVNPGGEEGALTTYVRVPAMNCAHRPPIVSPVEAAGVGAATLTALRGLIDICQLQAGQHIFINGGSSSVGAFAIQVAKALGARVTASASGRNEAMFVDYTVRPLHETLTDLNLSPKYNCIYDAVGLAGPELYTHCEAYLSKDGIFVSTGPLPASGAWSELAKILKTLLAIFTPSWLGGTPRKWRMHTTQPSKARFLMVQKMIEEGQLKAVNDSVHEFEDALEAFARVMTGRARGKVVVRVNPASV